MNSYAKYSEQWTQKQWLEGVNDDNGDYKVSKGIFLQQEGTEIPSDHCSSLKGVQTMLQGMLLFQELGPSNSLLQQSNDRLPWPSLYQLQTKLMDIIF